MSDELWAAAEQLRGIDGPTFHGVGGKRHISEQEYVDAVVLARAWLAQYPADDHEPITPEWLRSIGFTDYVEPSEHCSAFLSYWIDRKKHNCAFLAVHWARPDNPQGHYWSANSFSLYPPAYPTTRGAVRRLLAALGVTVPEAAPCRSV